MTTERYDERCWTSTRQTNARRALGRDPQVSMYCYINMRNALEDLVPVPGHPTAFLARDAGPTPDHLPAVRRKGAKSDRPEGVPEYHWPWLDGRFVYVARGRDNVARHMREMGGVADAPRLASAAARDKVEASAPAIKGDDGAPALDQGAAAEDPKAPSPSARRRRTSLQHGATPAAAAAAAAVEGERVGAWETIQRIEDRVEKQEADKLLPGKREERILRRAMGFEDDRYASVWWGALTLTGRDADRALRCLPPPPRLAAHRRPPSTAPRTSSPSRTPTRRPCSASTLTSSGSTPRG